MLTDELKKYILDFSECNYLGEIHQKIQTVLGLPDWYGQNLDALWDAITGIMYLPAEITIIFQPQTIQALQLSEEVDKIITVFKEAANEFGEIVLNIVK
ncbi:MAG: barstar family protein [Ruminococcus sp.]